MPSLFPSLTRLLADPPPEMVFEISPDCVRMARVAEPRAIRTEPLPSGVISPSPVRDNVVLAEPLSEAIERLAPDNGRRKTRTAALLLPDYCAHVAVLDFDEFPEKAAEQLALVRFRIRKSVPFDVESAALSFWVQAMNPQLPALKGKEARKRKEVVVAVTGLEIVSRYEAPFRAAGIQPGLVTLSPLACLDLVSSLGTVLVARLSGHVLSLLVMQGGRLKLVRSIELSVLTTSEIASHLHPTVVYIEDNLGAAAEELLLAGFGERESEALRDLPDDLRLPVRSLGGADTGIRGYLQGYLRGVTKGAAA